MFAQREGIQFIRRAGFALQLGRVFVLLLWATWLRNTATLHGVE